ncbi:perlucin-like protein [Cynoglossus semilaevis]|uniref:perlucin-like protein n=1 Tax=Cynoglossus semilaevis TaxID=244447 RepID=UPI000D62FBE0|nr:perlucin-like protein [Cynoglossus semilaevis]
MDGDQSCFLWLLGFAALFVTAQCQCHAGWRIYKNNCYYFSTDQKSWLDANAYCLGQRSNLMSIQDIQERMWLRTQIGSDIYWFGLNDRVTEGVYQWSDGTQFIEHLSYWMHGQPDNWDDEDCGQVVGYNYGQWNDDKCSSERKYICKHVNRTLTYKNALFNSLSF